MSSYQYRKSHCGDKTVVRLSYLHNWWTYGQITPYHLKTCVWKQMPHGSLQTVRYLNWWVYLCVYLCCHFICNIGLSLNMLHQHQLHSTLCTINRFMVIPFSSKVHVDPTSVCKFITSIAAQPMKLSEVAVWYGFNPRMCRISLEYIYLSFFHEEMEQL